MFRLDMPTALSCAAKEEKLDQPSSCFLVPPPHSPFHYWPSQRSSSHGGNTTDDEPPQHPNQCPTTSTNGDHLCRLLLNDLAAMYCAALSLLFLLTVILLAISELPEYTKSCWLSGKKSCIGKKMNTTSFYEMNKSN
jgi:hypothetical protein